VACRCAQKTTAASHPALIDLQSSIFDHQSSITNHPSSFMLRYRLLAVDIDGTLVNSRDELSPVTREALVRAGKSGIHVVLATGRRYSRVLPLVEPLGIEVPLVTASGALVKDPRDHRTLYQSDFDRSVLCEAMVILDEHGYDPVVCADTYSEGFDFYQPRPEVESPELAEYFRLNPGDGRIWPELLTRPPPGVFTCFTMGTRAEMVELEHALHDRLPQRLSTHVLRSPRYTGFMCEFAPYGVTKWSAIRRLAERWKIPDNAICAVGDDVNDVPMIRAAGLGVAMGNALPDVKAAADRIAPSQADDGLVEVVGWLIGGSPS
jgi:Cof subfamily protein (haloacid dehalogenase superfamily)